MSTTADNRLGCSPGLVVLQPKCACQKRREEQARDGRYPISRWYLRPAAGRLARWLAPSGVRPVSLTVCGLVLGAAAAALLVWRPETAPAAAALVLAAWFCDRTDGQLARWQGTVTPWGAWLDANVDELLDVGLHTAVAAAAAGQSGSTGPWLLLAAFLAGKYLFMQGLTTEEASAAPSAGRSIRAPATGWLARGYHLPANADVRVHLLAVALATGWLTAELAAVAVYYNLRWIARYVLVARRLGGAR